MSPFWIKKHPPHPPGARRVKLIEIHLEPKLSQKTEPPYPPPARNYDPGGPGSTVNLFFGGSVRQFFFVSFLGCLFSIIFRIVDDFWLRFCFNLGSVFVQFRIPFSDPVFAYFFLDLYSFLEPWILPNHCFTIVERWSTENHPTRTI